MTINKLQVQHLADLSNLCFSETDLEMHARLLSEMLLMFNRLASLPTKDIDNMISINRNSLKLRDDVSNAGLSKEELFCNAQCKRNGYFTAPKII